MSRNRLLIWARDYRMARIFIWQQLVVGLLFLLPLFLISGFVYRFSRDIARDEVGSLILSSLERFADRVDREIATTALTSVQLLSDSRTLGLALTPGSQRDLQFVRSVQRLQTRIGTFTASSPLVQEFLVYFPAKNYLVKSTSGTTLREEEEIERYAAIADLAWSSIRDRPASAAVTTIEWASPAAALVLTSIGPSPLHQSGVLAIGVITVHRTKELLHRTTGWEDGMLTVYSGDGKLLSILLGDDETSTLRALPDIPRADEGVRHSDFVKTESAEFFAGGIGSSWRELNYSVVIPLVSFQERFATLDRVLAAMLGASVVLTIVLSMIVTRSLFQPMRRVLDLINQPPRGLSLANSNAIAVLDRIVRRYGAERSGDIEESLRQRFDLFRSAQAIALQSQIGPHFLSNTLEAVNWAAMRLTGGSNEASEMLSLFSKALRIGLNQESYVVPLSEELLHVGYFMELQNIRFSDRMTFHCDADEAARTSTLPKLTLQPLVENAVHHGIRPREHTGRIDVVARVVDSTLTIMVRDDGVGVSPAQLRSIQESFTDDSSLSGQHVGLANVHQRIRVLYGRGYGLTVQSTPEQGMVVTVRLPATPSETEEAENDD